jgi:hypothetical protein
MPKLKLKKEIHLADPISEVHVATAHINFGEEIEHGPTEDEPARIEKKSGRLSFVIGPPPGKHVSEKLTGEEEAVLVRVVERAIAKL